MFDNYLRGNYPQSVWIMMLQPVLYSLYLYSVAIGAMLYVCDEKLLGLLGFVEALESFCGYYLYGTSF